ncbi:uncharacterized protein LOC110115596 [Dendrobium catenatum]|uniref:Uncharacterized protein n=1 Tax=Dendrobium catenatum TaxID=906689 RepID=A0A2I0W5P4_9ASPA|nr:uncharacterized protein LOC110115596 [Dendrobium catenatum]PKU70984.1 hypothetical protein MA16_Dca025800 [Dendrobium catenatum]
MGTKVQFKSYIPIHNVMRNKNEHSSNSWSWYYQDNALSGHLYDGSLLREANGYSLCDKEMLKRTMLEHEATFTKQVSELHRLYRIQKELMNELKNREKLKLCSTFQTNLFASHMLSEATEELQQMPYVSALSSHGTTGSGMELPLKHFKESGTRYFQIPVETAGPSIEGNFYDPKTIKFPRKNFDLHLPAEVYIDIDDDPITDKQNKPYLKVANPSSITHNADDDNNVRLSPRSKADGSINGNSMQSIHHSLENVSPRVVLDDLNEPLKPSSYEEGGDFHFSQVIGSSMEHEEIMKDQLHSNKSSLCRDFFLGNPRRKQTASNSVISDKVECLQGWQSSTTASGKIRSTASGSHGGLCDKVFSVISQLVEEKPNNCDEYDLSRRKKSDKWIGETPSPDTEPFKSTSKLPNLNSSELLVSQVLHPLAKFSHLDDSSISSASFSAWRNLNGVKQIPTAAQLLPSFNDYAVNNCRKTDATFQNPCNPCDNVQYVDGNLKKRVKVDLSSCQNDFHQDLKLDSIFNTQTCLPLIISGKSSQTNCLDNVTLENYNVPADPECSGVKQSLVPSWLRKTQAPPDSAGIEQSASQLMSLISDPNVVAPSVNEQKNNKKVSASICTLVDASSSLPVMERNEASCSLSSKRILQFESIQQGVECDLSSVDSLASLPKDKLPSSLPTANFSTKISPKIDLERLLNAAEEKSKKVNCNLITANKEADLKLINGNHEVHIREAAENLVAMSLLIDNHSHDITCPSIPNSFDTLYWFANFITSTEVGTGISGEQPSHFDDEVDGLDLFEYMTLKLKEIKEDEFFHKLQENQNYDDTSSALMPISRSQRGLARKRRQRRDFQKDILPGLTSLSRHEIFEDLQNFEGIMRASGKSFKAGSSKRSTSHKASKWQSKARQRLRSLAITVTKAKVGSLQNKDANNKQEISTTGILGWGRTTRRCHRTRLLPGNLSVSLA